MLSCSPDEVNEKESLLMAALLEVMNKHQMTLDDILVLQIKMAKLAQNRPVGDVLNFEGLTKATPPRSAIPF